MADFIAGLEEATAALEDFAQAATSAGGTGGARANAGAGSAAGGGRGGRGSSDDEGPSRGLMKAFALAGGAAAINRIGGAAVEGAMADGGAGALGSANMAAIGIVQQLPYVGQAISAGLGLTQQASVFERTKSQVIGDLGEFAKYGIEISDEMINEQIGIRAQQQSRVYELEKKIAARTAQRPEITRGEDASSGRSEMTAFEKFATAIDRFKDWVDALPFSGGGSGR